MSSSATPERLQPVALPELRLQAAGRRWLVEQPISGLASLTPVRGTIEVIHHGNALELRGCVETIVTLCCDRCLQHFNLPLRAEVEELVEFRQQGPGQETFSPDDLTTLVAAEDLDDRLDPTGFFDPERWLFEQLSLRLPLVNRCGRECPGPAAWSSAPATPDPRWAALQRLQS